MLRVDGILQKFDAAEVLEIAKNNEICAATIPEARLWRDRLRTSIQDVRKDGQRKIDEIRSRISRTDSLRRDAVALRTSLDAAYTSAEASIKSSIVFVLDVLLGESAVLDNVLDAAKSYALGQAIGDDALAFGASGTALIVKKTHVARDLGRLSLSELSSDIGAAAISEQWIKPAFDSMADISRAVEESTAKNLLRADADMTATLMTARLVLGIMRHTAAQADHYIAKASSRFDGNWVSTDPTGRFQLSCSDGNCVLTEVASGGTTLMRTAQIQVDGANARRIERANDSEVLSFLGYQATLKQEILARGPQPSYLVLAANAGVLSGEWHGILVIKDARAHLRELRQPSQVPGKQFSFRSH